MLGFTKKVQKEITSLQNMVEHVLDLYDNTRNSDTELRRVILQKFYQVRDWVNVYNLDQYPSIETVSRIRRKFNQQGMYLPTDPTVAKCRSISQEACRSYYARFSSKF